MACLSSSGENFVAIALKNKLRVYRDSEVLFSHINVSKASTEGKKQSDSGNEGTTNFLCHAFSHDQSNFAAITDDKKLLVWDLTKGSDHLIMTKEFPKRPTAITFLHKEKAIIVSDKYGDVFKCVVAENDTSAPTLILGHLSMVLGVEVSEGDEYIVSADRDEKIRTSCYPNTYSVHNYCLGHKNLVSCIKILKNNNLLSTSADKTIRLWNYLEGKEIFSLDLKEHFEEDFVPLKFAVSGNQVVLIAEKLKSLVLLEVTDSAIKYNGSHVLHDQPMDVCFPSNNGDICVVTSNKEKQTLLLSLVENKYLEKDCGYILEEDWKEDLETESKYLSNLVKPIRGKRAGEEITITPESTINFENALDNGNKKKKVEE